MFAPGPMVRLGGNIWENGPVPTLRAEAKRGDAEPHILVIDGTRVDDVRVYDDGLTPCLKNRMGTGGNNVPFIAQETTHDVIGTIQARSYKGPNHENARDGQLVIQNAIPIQDGRHMNKQQNGLGVGSEGDPSYTLDQTGAQSVAIPIQGTIIGRSDTAGPQGRGAGDPGAPMYTLDTISQHGVEHMMQVRRLTPIECERLMGWPDNHTAIGTNGPISDTNRYKMCGNGVASPVAQWIGEQLMAIHSDAEGSRPDAE